MKTLAQLASEAGNFLMRDTQRDIVLPTDNAPDWFTDLCRKAHNDKLPNDWSYEFIQDALNQLENDEETEPDVDSLYPYTADRLRWLSSHLDRPAYCDQAMEDFGCTFTSLMDTVALGMQAELAEVFHLVSASLSERLEEEEVA